MPGDGSLRLGDHLGSRRTALLPFYPLDKSFIEYGLELATLRGSQAPDLMEKFGPGLG